MVTNVSYVTKRHILQRQYFKLINIPDLALNTVFENHQKSLIFLKIAKSAEQKLLNFLGTKNGE